MGLDETVLHGHSFTPVKAFVLDCRVIQLELLFFAEDVDKGLKCLACLRVEASAIEDLDRELRVVDEHIGIVRLMFLDRPQLDALMSRYYGLVTIALSFGDLSRVDVDVLTH